MDRRVPSAGAVFLASWAVPVLAGAAAGLGDGLLAWIQGRSADPGPALLLHAASLGALLAWAAALPFSVIPALLRRPRQASARVAITIAAVPVLPLALVAGRWFYKRIPWGAADLALGLLVDLALVALLVALAIGISRLIRPGLVRGLAWVAAPALLLLVPAGLRLADASRPPAAVRSGPAGGTNLLLLSVDTLRPDRLGFTGDPRARTPWLDRLARRGTTWSDCLAPSPWTLPSLGSLLTGSYPGQHRILEELSGLSDEVTSIADVTAESGLRSAAFVSNPWLATGSLSRGFDTFDVAERIETLDVVRGTRLYGALAKTALRTLALDRGDRLSEKGIVWVRGGEGAWFLWLHYFDPHLPNWPAAPWDRLFGPAPSHVGSALTVEEIRAGDYPGGAAGREEIERLYDGEIAFTDACIGNVLRALAADGELARTAIAFSADHGEEFWDHGGYGHGHAMFDETVRVPLVIVPPGGVGGRVVGTLARLVDLAPTALAAAELDGAFHPASPEGAGDPPEVGLATFAGIDLTARPEGAGTTYGEATLYGPEQKFLRAGRWKLVLDPLGGGTTLYDLDADPAEQQDLAAAHPALADSLRTILGVWFERVGSAGSMAARDLPEGLDPDVRAQLEALGYTQ